MALAAVEKKNNYKPFGIFRYILAILVLDAHSKFLCGFSKPAFHFLNAEGYLAVMGFFILSGYVINEALQIFYQHRVGMFFLNRSLRIFPPYYAALFVSIIIYYILYLSGILTDSVVGNQRVSLNNGAATIVHSAVNVAEIFSPHNILSNILVLPMIHGVGMIGFFPAFVFIKFFWALNVEILFYILLGVFNLLKFKLSSYFNGLLNIKQRFNFKKIYISKTALKTICFAMLFLLYFSATELNVEMLRYYHFIPYFFCGICIHKIQKPRSLPTVGFLLSLIGIFHELQCIVKRDFPVLPAFGVILGFIIVIFLLANCRVPERFKDIDRKVGDLSYPIYLNHATSVSVFPYIFVERNIFVLSLCWIVTHILSYFMLIAIEFPLKKMRNRVRGKEII